MSRSRPSPPPRVVVACVVLGCVTLGCAVLFGSSALRGDGADDLDGQRRTADAPLRRRVAAAGAPADAGAASDGASGGGDHPPSRVRAGRTLVLTALARRDGAPAAIARELLEEHRAELGIDAMPGELVLERELTTLAGHHVRFCQVERGVRVFGSRVSAHVGHDGQPLLLRADVYPLVGVADEPGAVTPRIDASAAADAAVALLFDDDDPDVQPRVVSPPELVVLPQGRRGALVWHVGVRVPAETLRVFVDARDGAIVRADDARVAAEGRGLVFHPNPIHSSGNGTLLDQGDRDQAALTNQMELVTLPRLDGTGYLVGQWANLRDSPVSTFDDELDWTWVTRSHHAFEQVMAYYHVDRVQDRLQSLGLTNVNAESQHVNAHAAEHDQSIYDIIDDRLEFGDGGVDDAEDADVIVHEYGHAMQFDQVGTFGLTGEGGAMGEGFGDFLAVVFHESARPAWDPLFGSWDASAIVDKNPPFLRRVDRDKRFPDDFEGQVHADGEIWSRFLMDLRYLIGADDALRVVVESHFFLTPNARFREGCDALLVANIGVRGGRDDASIRRLLDARGLPYLVPSAPLPPEEDSEENDTLATAAPLTPGHHEQFLLADEDWFRVTIPAFRRVLVRAEHDPAGIDMDLEAYTADGVRSAVSAGPGGFEELELTAGPEGATAFVRGFNADPESITAGAYDLTVTETELEAFGPNQTIVREMEPGDAWVFRVSVASSIVDDGAWLKVKTRRLKRGAKTDLRLFTPSLDEVVDLLAARKRKGGKALLAVDESGDWIGVVTPREGEAGRVKLRVKLY